MAGPCGPGAPAARWKSHIVRQLRQRDRTQKALFLELVPACECARGAWMMAVEGMELRESVSGFSGGDASAPMPSGLRSPGPAALPSVTPRLRTATSLPFPVRALRRAQSWTQLLLVPLAALLAPLGPAPRHELCFPGTGQPVLIL